MTRSGQYFRAGVGAIITDGCGRVLALERSDIPNAWQMPQGGLEEGEEPLQAVLREIQEETGIPSSQLKFSGAYPELLAYELPPPARSQKTGRGQVHYWFLFKLRERGNAIDLHGSAEFRAWCWMSLEHLIDKTVEFRVPIYRRLATYFADYLDTEARHS